jgi:DNA gyrase subunit A
MLIRIKVKDIRETVRAAQGVKLIDLDEGDSVVAVAKLAEPEDVDDEPQAALPTPAAPDSRDPGPKPKEAGGKTPFLDDEE